MNCDRCGEIIADEYKTRKTRKGRATGILKIYHNTCFLLSKV